VNKKVKFAVWGYGFIGKKHAELIKQNPNSELVAIVDIDSTKASDNSSILYTSVDAFIQAKLECDFICICTPNYLHVKHCEIALNNKYNCICEKPLGLELNSCENLIKLEQINDKKVICVLQNRYSPPIVWLKNIIENQLLGKVFHIQINCYWNRDDRYYFPNGQKHLWKGIESKDGGVLFTQFSHFVDILTWCFGIVKDVNHISTNFTHKEKTDFDDTGIISFKTQDGALGNLNYSTAVWDKNLESSMIVIGEKGSLKIGGQYMDQVTHCHIDNYTMPVLAASQPPNDYGHYKGSAQNHVYVIENAIDFILNDGKIDIGLVEGIESVKNIIKLNYRL
jgi:UDP-N-acetyl-2-amino-2-deoxyglucuronate dehydrogenase